MYQYTNASDLHQEDLCHEIITYFICFLGDIPFQIWTSYKYVPIALYLLSVVPISLGVIIIFVIKAVPIFLASLVEFWKVLNLGKAFSWYRGVLTGNQPAATSGSGSAGGARSGHAAWSSPLKKATKGARTFIEGYANIQICTVYGEKIRNHGRKAIQ